MARCRRRPPSPASRATTCRSHRGGPNPGALIASRSDEFDTKTLGAQWSWIRQPSDGYSLTPDGFEWRNQNADLFVNENSASVLVEDAPVGDFIVETRVRLNVPDEGCCFNFRQGALVIYANDDDFVKLGVTSIWNTRQTEWAKEESDVPEGYPRQGNSIVGAPGEWTDLRIVRTETESGVELYQAWTRTDGNPWTRGGTWTHDLTGAAGTVRIGLVSMGAGGPASDANADYRATFDYVRVYELNLRPPVALPHTD